MADRPTPPAPAASSERVSVCAGKFEVFSGNPVSALDFPGARAFAAQGTRGASGILAYVVRPGEFPRYEIAANALKVNNVAVLRFLEADVAYWNEFNRNVPVLLFERPAGPQLMTSLTEERAALTNEVHFRQAVESMAQALQDIYLSGANHGRINPTNIFVRDAASGALQLGDYLTTACGKHQHPAYCTIEHGLADPCGRGPATSAEDIYAVGVTLLHLILGKLPLLLLSADEIVRAKIERGSLMALSGGMRIPSAYSEILRGMLADDPAQRWALDDIAHWLGGRRLGSKPASQTPKAQRGFDLAGQSYNNVRLLALSMARNVDATAHTLEDGSLDRWLRRSLGDEAKAEKTAEAIASAAASPRGGSPSERAVTRVAITLDPLAPIRFRDVSVLPGGIGPLLADCIAHNRSPRNIADLISAQFLIHWVNSQPTFGPDSTSLLQTYEGQRMLLDRPLHGFGIERVLYELNPNLPCLSSMVETSFPMTLKSLAQAIEIFSASVPDSELREPMDRHIAAFILSRHKRMNDRLFPLLGSNSDPGQRAVAVLSILAEIQRKFNPEPMPKTAEWLARLLQPSMERFHNRALREKVLRDVKKLARRGELDQMLSVIDDGNLQKQDSEGFDGAHREWLWLEQQARDLSGNSESRDRALLQQGQQITAFVSALAAMAAIVITVFVKLV